MLPSIRLSPFVSDDLAHYRRSPTDKENIFPHLEEPINSSNKKKNIKRSPNKRGKMSIAPPPNGVGFSAPPPNGSGFGPGDNGGAGPVLTQMSPTQLQQYNAYQHFLFLQQQQQYMLSSQAMYNPALFGNLNFFPNYPSAGLPVEKTLPWAESANAEADEHPDNIINQSPLLQAQQQLSALSVTTKPPPPQEAPMAAAPTAPAPQPQQPPQQAQPTSPPSAGTKKPLSFAAAITNPSPSPQPTTSNVHNSPPAVRASSAAAASAVAPTARKTATATTTTTSTTSTTSSAYNSVPEYVRKAIQHKDTDYNPSTFNCNPKHATGFVIKSFSADDVHKSIKYNMWTSTTHGNRRLNAAYKSEASKGPIYLFFSVNASGHFCGIAEMTGPVDETKSRGVWAENDKYKGEFPLRWIFVKDVQNRALQEIKNPLNEDKPVCISRDTQEIPCEQVKQMLKVFLNYKSKYSIFDKFPQFEEDQRKKEVEVAAN